MKSNFLLTYLFDQDAAPKEDLRVSEINVVFADEKTHKPNSLQITWLKDGQTRNYFVASDSGEVCELMLLILSKISINFKSCNTMSSV